MKAVIFANGKMTSPAGVTEHSRQAELIIAVDGGAGHCRKLNILPHVLLGDLDSVQPDLIERYEKAGVIIQRYPACKDKTDLELALDLAAEQQATTASIFGALGLRWDMSMANLILPAAPAYAGMRITLFDGSTCIHLIRGNEKFFISGSPGSTVSLIPLGGSAEGVTLKGFKYPLANHTISHASTLGVSNVMLGREGNISLKSGILLCIVDKS